MKNLTRFTSFFLLFLLCKTAVGQIAPTYTQYMLNPLVINPAFAGYHEMLTATASQRFQWAGVEGAPTTTVVNGHTTLPIEKMGAGINLVRESFGITTNIEAALFYSYQLRFGERKLQIGSQVGIDHLRIDYDPEKINFNASDQSVQNGSVNETEFLLGLGVLYSAEKYFIGASIPRLTNNTFDEVQSVNSNGAPTTTSLVNLRQGYVTAGYIVKFSSGVVLKPSFLLRLPGGGLPVSYDVNASLLLREKIWLATSLRMSSSNAERAFVPVTAAIMGQLQISEVVRVGYATDISTRLIDNDLRRGFGGFSTHELLVNVNFAAFGNQVVRSFLY